MKNFTFVQSDDWTSLYMDDNLIIEGHSLNPIDLLHAISVVFPNKVETINVDEDILSISCSSLRKLKEKINLKDD